MASSFPFSLDEQEAERRVSRHELRRYAAGELDEGRRAQIAAELEKDPALKAELEKLEAADRAFKAAMPFERFVADHERRKAETGGLGYKLRALLRRFSFPVGAGALAAAAAVLVVVMLPRAPAEKPWDGIKGGARIGYLVREAEGARFGKDGERLRPGDQIQFAVRDDPERRSMVLLGIDGKGQVSVYLSQRLPEPSQTKGGADEMRLLEQSLVLDDAIGPERFFVVFGDADPAKLRARAEAAARELIAAGADLAKIERLPLDDEDIEQSSVHIVKVE